MATKKDYSDFITKTRHETKSCEPISKLNITELKKIADKMGFAGQRARAKPPKIPKAPKPVKPIKDRSSKTPEDIKPAKPPKKTKMGLHNILRNQFDAKKK